MNYMGYYQECGYSYPQNFNQVTPYQMYDAYAPNYPTNSFNVNNFANNNHFNVIYEEGDEVNQLRRSFDFYNLV